MFNRKLNLITHTTTRQLHYIYSSYGLVPMIIKQGITPDSLNYCLNNPLSYSDQGGMLASFLAKRLYT